MSSTNTNVKALVSLVAPTGTNALVLVPVGTTKLY
jgi:hypothetical protein